MILCISIVSVTVYNYVHQSYTQWYVKCLTFRPLGYERVYLPLCNVADTPFHIQGDELYNFKFLDLLF